MTFDHFTIAIPPAALQDLAWHRTEYLPSSFVGIHWYVVKFHSTLGWFLRPGTATGCFLVFALGFAVGFRAKLLPTIMPRMIFAYTGIHFYRSTRYFWMKEFCIHIRAQKLGKIAKISSKMLYFLQYTGLNQNLRFVTANLILLVMRALYFSILGPYFPCTGDSKYGTGLWKRWKNSGNFQRYRRALSYRKRTALGGYTVVFEGYYAQ